MRSNIRRPSRQERTLKRVIEEYYSRRRTNFASIWYRNTPKSRYAITAEELENAHKTISIKRKQSSSFSKRKRIKVSLPKLSFMEN